MDRDGNLILTYDVSVYCHNVNVLNLGMGYNAVARFVRIVGAGIPEAKNIKELWANNYWVTFTGEGLTAFLNKYYPEIKTESIPIDPNEEYRVDCYDMS